MTVAQAVSISNISKTFGGRWRRQAVHAVRGVSLTVAQGETLAIVGESGSGKSTLARMLVGLEVPSSGEMTIAGRRWADLHAAGPKEFGRAIQYVFQDPVASLNPRRTIAQILAAPLWLLRGHDAAKRAERSRELLAAVQLPLVMLDRYPHELSGGQAQRVAIARALAAEAGVIVLDEPVSALDVSVQAQVMVLLDDLRRKFNLSYIFISHDLAVVEALSDRVAVMFLGQIVETGPTEETFATPRHDYTKQLLASAPRLRPAP